MRLNWLTELRGASVTLRPYRASHVSRYHAWMSDAALLEATASEQLTLAEEHANQRAWVDDESSERTPAFADQSASIQRRARAQRALHCALASAASLFLSSLFSPCAQS